MLKKVMALLISVSLGDVLDDKQVFLAKGSNKLESDGSSEEPGRIRAVLSFLWGSISQRIGMGPYLGALVGVCWSISKFLFHGGVEHGTVDGTLACGGGALACRVVWVQDFDSEGAIQGVSR